MAIKQPKILFFIDGPVPTPDNKRDANAYKGKGAVVAFRNARYSRGEVDGAPEAADGVMGNAIPKEYTTYPSADTAVSKYAEAMDKEASAFEASAARVGGVVDNMGTASYPDPGQRPVAAQTQGPGIMGGPALSQPAPPPNFTGTVGTPGIGVPANAAGITNPPQVPPGAPVAGVVDNGQQQGATINPFGK